MWAAVPAPGGCPTERRPALAGRKSKAFDAISTPDEDTENWLEATSGFFDQDNRPIMLFDGVCNSCSRGVRFIRDNDRNRRMRYEALQSEAGKKLLRRCGRDPDDISSMVLVEKERAFIKSDAVLRVMHHMDLPFPQLAFFLQFIPLFLRYFAYCRYELFGRSESCEI